jgi:hypothetical protein
MIRIVIYEIPADQETIESQPGPKQPIPTRPPIFDNIAENSIVIGTAKMNITGGRMFVQQILQVQDNEDAESIVTNLLLQFVRYLESDLGCESVRPWLIEHLSKSSSGIRWIQ